MELCQCNWSPLTLGFIVNIFYQFNEHSATNTTNISHYILSVQRTLGMSLYSPPRYHQMISFVGKSWSVCPAWWRKLYDTWPQWQSGLLQRGERAEFRLQVLLASVKFFHLPPEYRSRSDHYSCHPGRINTDPHQSTCACLRDGVVLVDGASAQRFFFARSNFAFLNFSLQVLCQLAHFSMKSSVSLSANGNEVGIYPICLNLSTFFRKLVSVSATDSGMQWAGQDTWLPRLSLFGKRYKVPSLLSYRPLHQEPGKRELYIEIIHRFFSPCLGAWESQSNFVSLIDSGRIVMTGRELNVFLQMIEEEHDDVP